MSLWNLIFNPQEGDAVDRFLAPFGDLDLITPLGNMAQGYNQSEGVFNDLSSALAQKDALEEAGVKARVEGGPSSGYRVVSK